MKQYEYVSLLFALFVVPRILQRFKIPTAITSFALGTGAALFLGAPGGDTTLRLLATFGIVSLFLFAGLDVELHELRREWKMLAQHVTIQLVSLCLVAVAAREALHIDGRSAILLALALLTPSTGFILDSLEALGLPDQVRFWVKTKAIATELVALVILFVTLQSTSGSGLALSTLLLVALVALLPVVFRLFAAFVVPYAPRSEFAFLLMVAVACGVITYDMGVYYLVGAFVVGMVAQRLRERIPALASEQMLHSVESFASLFVPFYFFDAGSNLRAEDFGLEALYFGAIFLVVGVSVRVGAVWAHRRKVLAETLRETWLVSAPMLPTLVFTLVIGGILRDRGTLPAGLFGGLVLYAVANSILPALALRVPLPEVEDELLRERRQEPPVA